jgi:hypothetical protein
MASKKVIMNSNQLVLKPESFEEKVLWHCIVWSYFYYVLGALYVLGPVIGWWLLVKQARRSGLADIPAALQVWVLGMLAMLIALIIAHADFNLGMAPMVKSAIGWAKGWALIPLFMIIGCGQVRMAILARAASLLGIQTIFVLPLLVVAWALGLPGQLYVSPLSIIGGPGPEYFTVELYGVSPDNGMPRWRLFTPWAPALGMVMCVYFFLILNERDLRIRTVGLLGTGLAILASSSRLGLLCIPIVAAFSWLLLNLSRPIVFFSASPLALLCGLLADYLSLAYEQMMSGFHGARADSSRVRATLGRIALERWQSEAVIWGHGAVEKGPHLVEFMPIGSHHTWLGLLFVKGLVGVASLAIPICWTLCVLVRYGTRTRELLTALRLLLLIVLYTFAENLEILSYLYWPGLVVIGIALKQVLSLKISVESVEPSKLDINATNTIIASKT